MLALALVSLSLMTFDYRREHISTIHHVLSTLVSPLQYIISIPFDALNWSGDQLQSRSELISKNSELTDEVFILKAQAQRLIELEAENARLRSLLGAVSGRREQRKIADILSVRASEFRHEIIVNKGTIDQTYVGQPVIDAEGLVGQVIEATPYTSRIMLITDERHSVPVRDLRSGVRAIAAGTGSLTRLELNLVPHSFDIREGDILVSSGLGERFPPGFPVARVTVISHDRGENYANIEATPMANLDRSGQVIMLWPSSRTQHGQHRP